MATPAGSAGPSLFGRDAECARVEALVDGARARRGAVLVLRGEPGIGKTALLEHAAAHAADLTVLRATGVEAEADLAFAGLHQLLLPVLKAIDDVPPVQADALRIAMGLVPGTADNRFVIALGVLTLLTELAESRPLLCLVDDIHWLDRPSLDALAFTGRRLGAEGVVLVMAGRSDEAPRGLTLPVMEVVALTATAADQLLQARFGDDLAPDVRRVLVAGAAGNPLVLHEVPAELSADQLAGVAPLPRPLPLGPRLHDVLVSRVHRLSPGGRAYCVVAAAEGTGDRRVVDAAAARLGVGDVARNEAVISGLLRRTDGAIAFRHPMVREVVYEDASPAQRHRAHAAVVDVLDRTLDADRRTWHRAAVAAAPDDDLANELAETARRADRRSGQAAAARAMRRSAELASTPDVRARRFAAAARLALEAGLPAEAAELLAVAEAHPDPSTQAELDHVRGMMAFFYGVPIDGAVGLIAGARAVAPRDLGKALQMLFDAGQCAYVGGDLALMRQAVELASDLRLPVGDSRAPLVELMDGIGTLLAIVVPPAGEPLPPGAGVRAAGAYADGLAHVLDRIASTDDPRWLVWASSVAAIMGDPRRDQLLGRRAESIARSTAAVGTLAIVLESMAFADVLGGRVAALVVHAEEGLALATETGLSNSTYYQRAMLAWAAAVRGDEAACLALTDAVATTADARRLGLAQSVAHWALGLLDLGAGEPERAATRLLTVALSPRSNVVVSRRLVPDLVEAAVLAGRSDVAIAATDRLTQQVRPGAPEWAMAQATRCRALVAVDAAAREVLFLEAAAQHRREEGSYAHARTLLLLGEHLRRERRRREARAPLQAALDVFEHLGATPWADRARRELRATGQTVRRRDHADVAALTLQERQVAAIVANGATNKEAAAKLFISPRTVEYHLRSVFAKLGISSRVELARIDARRLHPA